MPGGSGRQGEKRGGGPHPLTTAPLHSCRKGELINPCRNIQHSLLATSEIVQQCNFLMMGNDETSISNLCFLPFLLSKAAKSGSSI